MYKGKLLIITGPSGVGKDTILNMFRKTHPDWICPPSATTRQPRPGEIHSKDMIFLSREEFDKSIAEGKFLEYEKVTDNLYGTLKAPVVNLLAQSKNVVLRKEVRGSLVIKKLIPSALTVCLLPESIEVLKERLSGRGSEGQLEISKRLDLALHEMTYKDEFDLAIINPADHPEVVLDAIEKALNN